VLTTPAKIPSIRELIHPDDTSVPPEEVALIRLLERRFFGTAAVLPLMTPAEVKSMGLIGVARKKIIKDALEHLGVGMRRVDESLAGRAAVLFGSVEQTPVQALTLKVMTRDNFGTSIMYGPCNVLRVITDVDPKATIGTFLPDVDDNGTVTQSTRDKYQAFIFDLQGPFQRAVGPELRKLTLELEGRLEYWQSHR